MRLDSQASLRRSVLSPDGALVATLQQSTLKITSLQGTIIRSIPLSTPNSSDCQQIRWAPVHNDSLSQAQTVSKHDGNESSQRYSRVLLASGDFVHVYDVRDIKWSAVIEKASCNLGRIANVSFGFTENEILVFSDFAVKLTIWSLKNSCGVEIRDPKYTVQCYSYRPRTGHLAILTRPAVQDILMLLNPGDHTLAESIELPTVDAQGVSWSPDGQWFVVRDAASSGHKLFIYTADGHLFKTYKGMEASGEIDLGIKCMEWSSSKGLLALGDHGGQVTILGKNKFSPIATFQHPTTISLANAVIWQEQVSPPNERSYSIAPQPASPPTFGSWAKNVEPSRAISIMTFSADGSLLATKDDLLSSTVWIWSLSTFTVYSILIHHSPVKHIAWHPTAVDLLLIQCAIPEPSVHFWKSTWEAPRIVNVPLERQAGRLEASWILSPQASQYGFLLYSARHSIPVIMSSDGEIIQTTKAGEESTRLMDTGAEEMFDEGHSLDLSPIRITRDETIGIQGDDDCSAFGMGNEVIDDTFHYRRHTRRNG
ncbi:hypothetical protein ACLMJK_002483 [Lecanora helva]